jgi:hypothetical protein
MKTTFPGHFPPKKTEIERLWASCLFTVDTNILFNLYRYSDTTRSEFIRVLKAVKDRLWLPNGAAQEYFDNRLTVISQQESAYQDAVNTIKSLQTNLGNARQHPFLSDKLMQKLSQVLGEVVQEFESAKAIHANRILSDEIRDAIGDLFNGRVGPPYSDPQLETIWKEGQERYARKLPPGYKDEGKDDATTSGLSNYNYRKYGDLLIWRQIIDRATEAKKGIIFVNDDKKEDWWLIFRGKTLGPRPELICEFLEKTGQGFYMYQADRFLEYAVKNLKQQVTPASMDEIRDLRRRDRVRHVEMLRHEREARFRVAEPVSRGEEMGFREFQFRTVANEASKRLHSSRTSLSYIQAKLDQMQQLQALYQEKLDRSQGQDQESLEKFLQLSEEVASATRELTRAKKEMVAAEKEYASAQEMLAILQSISEERSEPGQT